MLGKATSMGREHDSTRSETGATRCIRAFLKRQAKGKTFSASFRSVEPPASVGWIFLVILISVFAAVNIRWIYLYRVGQPYLIDEAGYLTLALNDFRQLVSGGLIGWIKAIEAPNIQAPFATLITSLVFLATGAAPHWGFVTTTLAGVVLIIAGFLIARDIGGFKAAATTGLLIACNPAVLNDVRGYDFALPASAVTLLALLALLRSNGFREPLPSLAFGFFVGLMPLTRTMTIAFIPGLGLSALVTALPGATRRAIFLLIAAGAVALATMAIWLVPNGKYVASYLFDFGYGTRSANYGPMLSPAAKLIYMLQSLCSYIHVPSFVFVAIGLFLLAASALRRFKLMQLRDAALNSKLLPLTILVVEGFAVLMTSRNQGHAFALPLLAPLIILATCGLLSATRYGFPIGLAYGLVAIAALWPGLAMLDMETSLARPRTIGLPVLGTATLSDGRGPVQRSMAAAGYSSPDPAMPISLDDGRRWTEAVLISARKVAELDGGSTLTALAVRSYLFNTNSLNFVWMFNGNGPLELWQAAPEVYGDSVSDYEKFLITGDARSACQLLTATGTTGDILPAITDRNVAEAAQHAGFAPTDHWRLPDGRDVTLWRRRGAVTPCPTKLD
jgi:hypothetical protein